MKFFDARFTVPLVSAMLSCLLFRLYKSITSNKSTTTSAITVFSATRCLTCKTNMSCFLDIPATLGTPSKASSICCANNKNSFLKPGKVYVSVRNTEPRYEEGRSSSTPSDSSTSVLVSKPFSVGITFLLIFLLTNCCKRSNL